MEVVVAKGVRKVYGINKENQVVALKNIDLTINTGDYICVMGPSGAGKSTLLNVLSTIDLPTGGKVLINNTNIMTMSENQMCDFRYKNLGFIFQDFNLIDSLTVHENIAVPLTMAGVKKDEIYTRVHEIAKKINIESILNKYPTECSGGQRQRIAIARALVTNPTLIIADEPTGNLDTQNSHEIMMIFNQLNKEGVTILMVTHDSLIASYSKKLLYISDGEIREVIERMDKDEKVYFDEIVAVNTRERRDS